MAYKCSKCDLEFEEERRLEIHKKVHGRRSKVFEYGDPETNKFRIQG